MESEMMLSHVQENVRLEFCPWHCQRVTIALDPSQKFITISGCCEEFRQRVARVILHHLTEPMLLFDPKNRKAETLRQATLKKSPRQ
jgi:hypothetical protein